MELSCNHTNKHNWWTLDHFSVLHDKDPVLQRLLVELPCVVCSDASYKVCIKTISEKWDICVTISVCVESGEEPSLLCYLTSSDPSLGEPVHCSTLVTNLMYVYFIEPHHKPCAPREKTAQQKSTCPGIQNRSHTLTTETQDKCGSWHRIWLQTPFSKYKDKRQTQEHTAGNPNLKRSHRDRNKLSGSCFQR